VERREGCLLRALRALWVNASSTGAHQNEGDWFDTSIGNENSSGGGNGHFDTITQNVWKYFADYALYWLDKTGYPAGRPRIKATRALTVCARTSARDCRRKRGNTSSTKSVRANGISCS
jgi:hypothetical protein